MDEKTLQVVYGPNELEIKSGTAKNVGELRDQVKQVLALPDDAIVKIDDTEVPKGEEKTTVIPESAKEVTFVKKSGSKS